MLHIYPYRQQQKLHIDPYRQKRLHIYPYREQKLNTYPYRQKSYIALACSLLGKVTVTISEEQQVAIEVQVSAHQEGTP